MNRLRPGLVFGAVGLGLAFGLATVFAWVHGVEGRVAAAALVIAGAAAGTAAPWAAVRNGFAVGFVATLVAVWTQAALLDMYFINNPDYRAITIPLAVSARTWTIGMAIPGAVLGGAVSALLAGAVARVWRR